MPLVVGSADLSDEQFLSSLDSKSLTPSRFRHGDHLRFAWLLVHRLPLERAESLVRSTIRAFAERQGAGSRYHETVTLGWVKLIATHQENTFEEFLSVNEHRLTRELLHRFWTPELLWNEKARREWIAPDREPLPPIPGS